MQEIWKDIEGYEKLYQVSNLGNVKSLRTNTILKTGNGEYKKVILCNNGNRKTIAVHRLVAEAFIPNPNNYPQVNHKDENKHNNCIYNLEWCTKEYNENYGTRNNRIANTLSKKVNQYDLQGNLIKKWFNLREITLNTNYKKITIMYCCRGKLKTAYGYVWKYELIDSE